MHQQIPLASRKISVPSGTFLFMGVRYTNRAITTEQQIDILKERGLLIDDVERAVKALDIISYFRLAGYWRHFETDRFTHQVKEDSRFTDVIDFYFLINNSEPYCLLPSKRLRFLSAPK